MTGGTGALGRAVVKAFLDGGCVVAVPWIDRAEREDVSRLYADALSEQRLVLTKADVATQSGADAAVEAARAPEVLVNAAGGFAGGAPFHETGLEIWDAMFRINVKTAAAMCSAVLPGMLQRRSGVIINVASQAGADAPPGLVAYSTSKAAVAVLTRSLHNEVAEHGIRVNAVVPTTIDTPANREAMPDADTSLWTKPEQIARVIAWLASDNASSVLGGLIPV